MRKIMALLAFAGALTGFAPAAHAAPDAAGPSCGFVATGGPANIYGGAVWGGPVALYDFAQPTVVPAGVLTCTVLVDGSPGCSATALVPSTGTTAAASQCLFTAWPGSRVSICSRIDLVTGGTLHYSEANGWSPAAGCPDATRQDCHTEDSDPCAAKRSIVDPIVCPILQPFFPPEGDVGIFYDCPSYSTPPIVTGHAAYYMALPGFGT